MTRILPLINESLEQPRTVTDFPIRTRGDAGIEVQLGDVKQGTYDSKSATLITFDVTLRDVIKYPEAFIEIRMHSDAQRLSEERKSPPFVAVYGPSHIEEISPQARLGSRIPARVTMSVFPQGAILALHGRYPETQVVPTTFAMGIVVVHEQTIQLRVLPSMTDCRRARAFRRTTIRPLELDMGGELGRSLVTCALQEEGGCHSTCDDFGPTHMTPEVWKRLLRKGWARFYDGESPQDWVTYV